MPWIAGAEYYRERLKLPDSIGATMFVMLWGIGFGSAIFMAPLPISLLFGLMGGAAVIGGLGSIYKAIEPQRRGIKLDEFGVTELYWLQDPRRHAWDSIRDVRISDRDAVIVADHGEVRVSGLRQPAWLRLARRVKAAVTGEATEIRSTGDEVPAEQIAEWLGIPVHGELRCQVKGEVVKTLFSLLGWLGVTLLLTAFYLPFVLGIIKAEGGMKLGMLLFVGAHASIFFGVFSGGLLKKLLERVRGFTSGMRADVTGVWLGGAGGWHHHSWDDLQEIAMESGAWRVTTREDSFTIDPTTPNAARLVNGIQRVLRARTEGLRLPSGGPVPAAAISMVEDPAERMSAERGVSLTDAGTESLDA